MESLAVSLNTIVLVVFVLLVAVVVMDSGCCHLVCYCLNDGNSACLVCHLVASVLLCVMSDGTLGDVGRAS